MKKASALVTLLEEVAFKFLSKKHSFEVHKFQP
jgi:hypothetical protein